MNNYEYEIQANYGYGDGWECVNTEITRADAIRSIKEYRENEPSTPFRIQKKKIVKIWLKG